MRNPFKLLFSVIIVALMAIGMASMSFAATGAPAFADGSDVQLSHYAAPMGVNQIADDLPHDYMSIALEPITASEGRRDRSFSTVQAAKSPAEKVTKHVPLSLSTSSLGGETGFAAGIVSGGSA